MNLNFITWNSQTQQKKDSLPLISFAKWIFILSPDIHRRAQIKVSFPPLFYSVFTQNLKSRVFRSRIISAQGKQLMWLRRLRRRLHIDLVLDKRPPTSRDIISINECDTTLYFNFNHACRSIVIVKKVALFKNNNKIL
jgi:hypothetical protein